MVALGGRACVVALGGMHGCSRGQGMCGCSQMVCAWLLPGGHGWLLRGVCVVAPGGGGMHACSEGSVWLLLGGHAWDTTRYGDTINEQAVRILLECILVSLYFL